MGSAGSRHNYNLQSCTSITRRAVLEKHSLRTVRVPQSALAAKRITRLAALQNRISAQKISSGATRTSTAEKPEPAGQMLFSLRLQDGAPASGNSSDFEMSISMEEPLYDLLVHSPHLPVVNQLSSHKARGYDTDFSILSVMSVLYFWIDRHSLFETINLFRLLSRKRQIQT